MVGVPILKAIQDAGVPEALSPRRAFLTRTGVHFV